jgi:hypothetical protein
MRTLMRTVGSSGGLLFLTGALLLSIAGLGCTARVRYYDDYHHDYHRWNNHEVVYYHSYWDGRHQQYREYSTLGPDEQRDYWKWRHEHH